MERVTASEARKNWFRLLDEVAAGAVVCIERAGRRIVLRREPEGSDAQEPPDYTGILQVPNADDADRWSWRWSGPGGEIEPIEQANGFS